MTEMKTFITYGTEFFLDKIIKKYPKRNIQKFYSSDAVYLIENTTEKTAFSTPKSFEIINQIGTLSNSPTLLQYFTIKEARQVVFNETKLDAAKLSSYEGFKSYQLLKPFQGETYGVIFQFETMDLLKDFQKSSVYQNQFTKEALKSYASEDFTNNMNVVKYLTPEPEPTQED